MLSKNRSPLQPKHMYESANFSNAIDLQNGISNRSSPINKAGYRWPVSED